MNVYLLRHGQAENYADCDENRPLSMQGREEIINVAKQFLSQSLPLDRCIASPYLRAQQTADLFVSQLSDDLNIETHEVLVPEVRAAQVIAFLNSLKSENVLLVSHNPLLSELLALLNDGTIQNLKIVGTGELNCLFFDIMGMGMANNLLTLSPHGH